jgi:hypothetical protein
MIRLLNAGTLKNASLNASQTCQEFLRMATNGIMNSADMIASEHAQVHMFFLNAIVNASVD